MRERFIVVLSYLSKPVIALGGAVILAATAIGLAWQSGIVVPSGQYTAAVVAPITGQGGASSDLSFQVPGQVVAIPVTTGQKVSVGTTLVVLDQSALLATRAGAVANLEAAQANLAALEAGTRPEQLAIDQTAVTQAANALMTALTAAYTNADDAVHAKADQVFINPRNATAQLTILVPDAALVTRVQTERIALEPIFSSWSAVLASAATNPESAAAPSEANMKTITTFLNDLTIALAEALPGNSISTATITGYQTSVNTGRLNMLAALSNLVTADTAYKAAVGALTLAQAGATQNDLDAQKAVVDAAQAALRGVDVSLQESTLVAPLAGTITAMNARLGQTVAPGQILVSIESSGGSKPSALVVPTSSVIADGNQAFVYVKQGAGAPVETPVTTGLVSASGMTEIVSGLVAGQEVLTFGTAGK
ncbi:MAG TPA: biotin/lipoyl-binding protein [Candidatus Paceibacterota bacterium]|nr:biotin/lipoyl-binding protein [Candidatus Paceibacterota bacterium]